MNKTKSDDMTAVQVKLPVDTWTGNQLRNLVFMLHAQSYLLNRVLGDTVFSIPEACIEELKEPNLDDTAAFFTCYNSYAEMVAGIELTQDTVTFTVPPMETSEKQSAIIHVLGNLCETACRVKWVHPKRRESDNEKYYFRMWLLRIGMGTPEYRNARRVLLQDLRGYSAFTSEEKAKAHAMRCKERRR